MRSSFASRGGFTLMKTPNHRQQVGRRRLAVICAVLAIALASGVIGSMTNSSGEVTGGAHTGPFSYFPSE
jgi:hypothetical protein